MTMVPFTVEEENLICMYHKSDRRRTAANIRAALPDMGEGAFMPGKRVTKVQVIRAWNRLKKLGLAK